MQIEFLEAAQAELDQAIEYYARESAGLGNEFLAEVLCTLERITDHPHAWHTYSKRTRRCQMRRFPYGVIYLISMERVLVVAIAHLHRKPGYWKSRLDS
jgi:plasmid stabilization system protein ParE